MRLPGARQTRERPPDAVLARAGAVRGDRVLASARAGETWLLGTPLALLVVPLEGEGVRRIPWERVDRAGWQQDDAVLELSEVADGGEARPVHRFVLPEPGRPDRLLQLVRERVTASIVLERRVGVFGRRGLTIHGRRPPAGGDLDEVSWHVDYDDGVHPDDPAVAERASAELARAKAELG